MTAQRKQILNWLLAITFFASALGIPSEESKEKEATASTATEHWTKPYGELHEVIAKLDDQVTRNFFPEFMVIKEGHTIASIQIDSFGAKVLKEADEILLPYREGLQRCVERRENEYRQPKVYSYERFAWFLDRYVRTLSSAIGGVEEKQPMKGVREKTVTTDRTLYAFTRLATAYLQERMDRFKRQDGDSFASDRALEAAITDIGRRVLRLDMTQKFDRREFVDKGIATQPVFRDLATHEGGANVTLGLEPLVDLMKGSETEPACEINLALKKTAKKD